MYNPELLLDLLGRGLGSAYRLKDSEVQFFCPKCNHHKRKLQVNLSNGKSHCWVCNFSAHTAPQLLQKINAPKSLIKEVLELVGDYRDYRIDKKEKTQWNVSLPECFHPLWNKSNDILYKHAINYLYKRGISEQDMLRYGIGYCSDGVYSNRIIIPSYDLEGKLNYYIARDMFPNSKMKYKNPPMSKDVVVFELFINWNKPIVLCEGAFDAIAIKRNAIPLLGKFPSKSLVRRIVQERVKHIYIALDNDARKDAVKLVDFFNQFGITAYMIDIQTQDPSELGFSKFWKLANEAKPTQFLDIIKERLYAE